jgi:carbamoyl-phosphate synthase large subunit
MLGAKIRDLPELKKPVISHYGVKEAVFPFNMFPEVDPILGPEMRATGEVMGIADTFGLAFYKAQEAAGSKLPLEGSVLITIANRDQQALLPVARRISELGFTIIATEGTGNFLDRHGIPNRQIKKVHQGRPNILDTIKNREIGLIINTPGGRFSKYDDSFIRMNAIQQKIPYVTTIAAAMASVKGIESMRSEKTVLRSLQEYYREKK